MKKLISIFMTVVMVFATVAALAFDTSAKTETVDVWDGSIATGFAGGTGTFQDPYLISTGAQLAYLAERVNSGVGTHEGAYVNKYFKLTNSINLDWKAWTPIGYLEAGSQGASCFFGGIFDGCGYTIYNLSAQTYRGSEGTADILKCGTGLFGALRTDNAVVKNIAFEGGAVICSGGMGGYAVGILSGKADVENIYLGSGTQVVASIASASSGTKLWSKVGGVVGQVAGIDCTIKDCVNYGTVTAWGATGYSGETSFGGICGDVAWQNITAYPAAQSKLTMTNCYFAGKMYATGAEVKLGALLGTQRNANVKVENCHVGGVVTQMENTSGARRGIVIGYYSEGGSYDYSNITVYKGEYVGDGVTYRGNLFTYISNLVGTDDSAATEIIKNAVVEKQDTLVVPTAPYEKFISATERGAQLYTVEKYEDISEYRAESGYTAPKKANMVFAGWFADADCKQAIASDVTCGGAYAKFVSESVLSVKVQLKTGTTSESDITDMRLITMVDSLNYTDVGFSITYGGETVNKLSNTVYSTIIAMGEEYLPTEFSAVSAYFATYSLTSVPSGVFDKDITIVPVHRTLDGTLVYGTAYTVTINEIIAKSN